MKIRAMTADDVPRACDLAREAGWRSREAFYALALAVPSCHPLVGTLDGEVVATGVATVSGRAGWVGTIVVAAAERGRGFGRTMTEAVCDVLRGAGCTTMLLIATSLGQPVYERMGFRVQTVLHLLEAEHSPVVPQPPAGTVLRSVAPDDLPSLFALDAEATGEDRSVVLNALAARGGHILEDAGGLRAFILPSDRGYSPIVAPRHDDGLFLAELHRHLTRQGGHARAGITDENETGRQMLVERGWQETWLAPRMILGPEPDWHPEWLWGQINFAMG